MVSGRLVWVHALCRVFAGSGIKMDERQYRVLSLYGDDPLYRARHST